MNCAICFAAPSAMRAASACAVQWRSPDIALGSVEGNGSATDRLDYTELPADDGLQSLFFSVQLWLRLKNS
jgi:hypothetical protein